MGKASLSINFAVVLSLSLAVSASSSFHLFFKPPSSPPPKATPSDLLALLGPTSQSSKIDPLISQQLRSCLKFLVPFEPKPHCTDRYNSRRLTSKQHKRTVNVNSRRRIADTENELVWWPPEPVLDLARLAVDSGGDPDAIHRALDPTVLSVPDVERCKENQCELTRTPYGRRFISQELNSYLEFLFELIVARGPAFGFNVSLNRYDLFHGHLFLATETGRLGILFHAKEYPAYDKELFPYNMGYCQKGSSVTYNDSMNLRNILWLAPLPGNSTKGWEAPGVLVILDAHPGGIIYRDLIPDYVDFARTIYEDDLGSAAADVNYLNVGDTVPNYQIYIC